jgi:hypothetical protein
VQHCDAHSLLSVHVGAQPGVLEPACMMQMESSQQERPVLPPHASPAPEHTQYRASTQKFTAALLVGRQQPLAQSVPSLQLSWQPSNSGVDEEMQRNSLQQLATPAPHTAPTVDSHCGPTPPHKLADAQMRSLLGPASRQQLVAHSESSVHRCWH